MGPEALLISAGFQLFQGFQSYQQGKAQAKAARQTADYNNQLEQNRALVEREKLKRQQRLFSGTQKTKASGSGATLGSFDDLFEDTTSQSLLDIALLDYDSKVRQQQTTYQANVEAANYKAEGRNALISGLAGAAGSYNQYKTAPKGGTTRYPSGETIYWNT